MHLLEVIRDTKSSFATIGTWHLDGLDLNIDSLEDRDRGLTQSMSLLETQQIKVQNETAIGTGIYPLTITKSTRFSKIYKRDMYMLEILNVVGFGGVRCHWGNKASDSDACVLTGERVGVDFVQKSRLSYNKLLNYLAPILDFTPVLQRDGLTIIELPKLWKPQPIQIKISSNYTIG